MRAWLINTSFTLTRITALIATSPLAVHPSGCTKKYSLPRASFLSFYILTARSERSSILDEEALNTSSTEEHQRARNGWSMRGQPRGSFGMVKSTETGKFFKVVSSDCPSNRLALSANVPQTSSPRRQRASLVYFSPIYRHPEKP